MAVTGLDQKFIRHISAVCDMCGEDLTVLQKIVQETRDILPLQTRLDAQLAQIDKQFEMNYGFKSFYTSIFQQVYTPEQPAQPAEPEQPAQPAEPVLSSQKCCVCMENNGVQKCLPGCGRICLCESCFNKL